MLPYYKGKNQLCSGVKYLVLAKHELTQLPNLAAMTCNGFLTAAKIISETALGRFSINSNSPVVKIMEYSRKACRNEKCATRRDSVKESTTVIREERRGNPLNKKNGSDTCRILHMLYFGIFLI